jgi:hypothetical protein
MNIPNRLLPAAWLWIAAVSYALTLLRCVRRADLFLSRLLTICALWFASAANAVLIPVNNPAPACR